MKTKITIFAISIMVLLFAGCKKTNDLSDVTFSINNESVTVGTNMVKLTADYSYSGMVKSIVMEISEKEDLNDMKTYNADISGNSFAIKASGLKPLTIYYYRIKSDLGYDIFIGEVKKIQTNDYSVPIVSTANTSDVTAVSVRCSGELLATNIDDFGSLWRGIYRRDFIEDNSLRFTEGIIHQDTDFNYRAYPLAKRVMIVDRNVYFYRNIGESATHTCNVEKLQLMSYSDFVVVKNIKDFISHNDFSVESKSHYRKLSNSLLVSAIMDLLGKREMYGTDFVRKCLNYSFENKLLPIKSETNSWKTTLLIPVINLSARLMR